MLEYSRDVAAVNSLLAVQDSKVGHVPRAYMASGAWQLVNISTQKAVKKLAKTPRLLSSC
jgi:hypothetical protein